MYVEYQIYLDDEQIKRKKGGKIVNYISLELNFINDNDNDNDSDSETENENESKLSNKNENNKKFESTIILKMYNDKIEKYFNSDKLLKKDYIEFYENMKNGKKCDLEEEYILHKYHYLSYFRYHKNKIIYTLFSPIFEYQTTLYIYDIKDHIIKIFKDFIESSEKIF